MRCKMCNCENAEGIQYCNNCGAYLDNNNDKNNNLLKIKNLFRDKLNIYLLAIFILSIILIVLLININKLFNNKRVSKLTSTNDNLKFAFNEDEFSIKDSFSKFEEKGYYIQSENFFINYDSIALNNIYKDKKVYALAAFYCPKKEGCNYKETNIVKLNAYNNSSVIIDGLNYDSSKEEVFNKLGKETGVLNSDNTYYIWSKGKKIGDSYIMIKFKEGMFSTNIYDIKIGAWWYKDEYKHTVKEN